MRSYLILVEAEDYIEVDAKSEQEAIEMAIEIADHQFSNNWKGTVMNVTDLED